MSDIDPSQVHQIMKAYGLSPKKFLGQNFLVTKKPVKQIVKAAQLKPEDHVVEIGPGLGILSQELLAQTSHVTSIELDKTLVEYLQQRYPQLTLIHGDALQQQPPSGPYKVVANIPYNITSPLINHYLQADNRPISLSLLIQKEVAEKICKLDPKMTVLSLQVALFGEAKIISKVPAGCFHPPPKVDSAIIHIETYGKEDDRYLETDSAQKILKLAKRAFSQRRKKLSNTLPELKGKTDLDLGRRPETLSVKEWLGLVG